MTVVQTTIPRRAFIVNTFDKETGAGEQMRVWAFSEGEAEQLVSRPGRIVQPAFLEPDPVVHLADDSLPQVPESLRGEVQLLRREVDAIRTSYLVRHPISTVAWGIIASFFLWALICIVVFAALVALGLLISPFAHR